MTPWFGPYHIIDSQRLETVADLVLQEVVGTERIDVEIFAHRDQLRTGQVVKSDIVVEQLSHPDDICLRGCLASRPDLLNERLPTGQLQRFTFRKNCLNSSLCTTVWALRPDSRTVSCKNLAISIRTRRSLRSFSAEAIPLSNVLGSMFGNRRNATGSRNSMKGTMTNTEKGIRRSRSTVVRFSCNQSADSPYLARGRPYLTALSTGERASLQNLVLKLCADLDFLTE